MGKTICKEREWFSSLLRRHFFSFHVLHVDAGEKSPGTQEIETVLKIKIKNTGEGCLDTVKTTGVVVRGGNSAYETGEDARRLK